MLTLDTEIERRLFDSTETDVERARNAARHLVLAGGKRIRPRLALLVAEAVGLNEESARIIGTAAELVHSATLLHDDVIDRSDQRRGQVTVNAKYGAGSAILTGDFLLAQALTQLLDSEHYMATRELSRAVRDLAEAEILQLQQAFDIHTTLEQTQRIATGKTGSLFAWCARAVVVTAKLPADMVETAGKVGLSIGYAFQVADDLLDFISGGTSGKPARKDLREGQITIPMQLERLHNDGFQAGLTNAFEHRTEESFDHVYDLLKRSDAERLGRIEIEAALRASRENLARLTTSAAVRDRFDAFIHDCTQRLV